MRDDRAEMIEHLKGLAEAVKLVVDRACALLVFLLTDWRAAEVQTYAPAPTLPVAQPVKPMTVKEAAAFYRVQENTIYELVKRRKILFLYVGESLRIPPIQPVEPLAARQTCAPARHPNVLQ